MEQILSSQPSEVTNAADALILEFKHLELWENKILLFKTPSYYYFVKAALKKYNQWQPLTSLSSICNLEIRATRDNNNVYYTILLPTEGM